MREIMAKRMAKAFITMKSRHFLLIFILVGLGFSNSCNKKNRPETIITGPVNLNIDLNLPSYQHLSNVGTYAYFAGGVKGVIVIHDFDDQWYAFERTCAWQPLTTCAIIWGDSINLQLRCGTFSGKNFTSCCESLFTFSGFPSKGPAVGRLATYKISKTGNLVSVYN